MKDRKETAKLYAICKWENGKISRSIFFCPHSDSRLMFWLQHKMSDKLISCNIYRNGVNIISYRSSKYCVK